MESINGTWIGEYKYGESYGEDFRGKSIKFSMQITMEGEILKGNCVDEESENVFKSPASIEGTYENGIILFYKTYPNDLQVEENKELKAREFDSSGSVQYVGHLKKRIFSKTQYFEGTWDINYSFLDQEKVPQHYELDGTWRMEKFN